MSKLYAGIGSRETPREVLAMMHFIGMSLGWQGWTLRSGGAQGADTAFWSGMMKGGGYCEIFDAEAAKRRALWFQHAARYHPAWENCSDNARRLHARNSAIILGDDLSTPVKFIVCWTDGGRVVGGTGQALRIAPDWSIPVFNLALDPTGATLWQWLKDEQRNDQ